LGVIIYYLLSQSTGDVSLSILDQQGNEIRTFGANEIPMQRFSGVQGREYGASQAAVQPRAGIGKGLNRFIWDMRYPSTSSIPGLPPVVINPLARPGTYQVRLTVDGRSQTQPFELKTNPNEKYSRQETDQKGTFWMELQAKAEEAVQAVLTAKAAQERVAAATETAGASAELKAQGAAVAELCADFIGSMVSTGTTLVQIISEPSKPLAQLTTLHNIMETTEGPPNQPLREVYAKVSAEMDEFMANFNAELATEMSRFNELSH